MGRLAGWMEGGTEGNVAGGHSVLYKRRLRSKHQPQATELHENQSMHMRVRIFGNEYRTAEG